MKKSVKILKQLSFCKIFVIIIKYDFIILRSYYESMFFYPWL